MKIVHVIDSLALGGTENQFLSLLPDLAREHEIVLVTLSDNDRPALGDLPISRRYRLNFSGPLSLPATAWRLRRIIRSEHPDLVRSQLYWSSVAARLATPRAIPLVFSIHSTMSEDGYLKRREALWLEKLTYRPRHRLVSVSQHALNDFDKHVGVKGPADVLPNFVTPEFAAREHRRRNVSTPLRLVAVGNLKPVKNYAYLVEALKGMQGIVLDIYGEGPDRTALERQIASTSANVRLVGVREDLSSVLPDYDLLVMPSLYEGCPNAALEAMASGLPLLLSDIPVMREVSQGNALFFDQQDPSSFRELLSRIRAGEIDLKTMARRGREIVEASYSKARYLERLNAIYLETVRRERQSRNVDDRSR